MRYTFNDYTVDTNQHELSRLGEAVHLEPQVLELLVMLIEHRGGVVSKEEINDQIWKGRVVSDSALSSRIKALRRVLADDGRSQHTIRTIHKKGFRFVADVTPSNADEATRTTGVDTNFKIGLGDQSPVQYCRSRDGVSIAHSKVGEGCPIVITSSWMSHLEEDWNNPGWGHHLSDLAKDFTLLRYDQRGNGMSDWDNVDISFDKMVDDLTAVIDVYGHERVAIFGPSQGAAVSVAYARQHPEKVSHLILYGGYSRGRRRRDDPESFAESEALVTLIRQSWGRKNPAIRQTMTSLFMPEANQQEANWFNEFQRTCGPAENIAQFREIFDEMDVAHLLDGITVPTLVIHCVGDSVAPLSEGKLLASRIPGAKFVTLNSDSHMVFENDPEFPRLLRAIRDFLKAD